MFVQIHAKSRKPSVKNNTSTMVLHQNLQTRFLVVLHFPRPLKIMKQVFFLETSHAEPSPSGEWIIEYHPAVVKNEDCGGHPDMFCHRMKPCGTHHPKYHTRTNVKKIHCHIIFCRQIIVYFVVSIQNSELGVNMILNSTATSECLWRLYTTSPSI